jgi:L-asparaginase
MQIQIFTVGGTIDKVYFDEMSRYEVGDPRVVEILAEANVDLEYRVASLMRKDSLEMTDEDRHRIRQEVIATDARRIVITHGTDTMARTGEALAGIPGKTIVLTGAMAPARFKSSDAVFNVGCAIVAVQVLPPGVYIAMNGRIFDPARVRKDRTRNRFEAV